ncbi:substrate-binding and VWA domain-containing protein [Actinoallomurus rhizosphaericola]|uniref:substrate-binding and VWA domain-containing protein n=1 Tax=Actinoallomurus rhizosphaericola TaxID=2952536 RepID=UPI002091D46C|nr:substrate-binding and VWA domain-containing protein [Actinoallomurus rhizosphaericola]MCO5992695.1 substrate-binding and VWA domain-containing protein [Actinoallomurus rhizosphaericola]
MSGRERTSMAAAVALVVGLALGGGGWLVYRNQTACQNRSLTVTADPAIAPVIIEVAARYNKARCADVNVVTGDSAQTAGLLASGGGAAATRPDVWIADSSLWFDGVRFPGVRSATSVASSPVVFAMTPDGARREGARLAQRGWGAFENGAYSLRLLDPVPSATGMTSLLALSATAGGGSGGLETFSRVLQGVKPSSNATDAIAGLADQGRPPVLPLSEQTIWQQRQEGRQVTAVYPATAPALDFPYAVLTADRGRRRIAAGLLGALRSADGTARLHTAWLRTPAGDAGGLVSSGLPAAAPHALPVVRPGAALAMRGTWQKMQQGLRAIALIDVSGATLARMGAGTRAQVMTGALGNGLSLLEDDTEFGLWSFPARARPYRRLVEIGPLRELGPAGTRRARLLQRIGRLRAKKGRDGGMYDAILDAYRELSQSYRAGMLNEILVLTGGASGDRDGLTLDRLVAELKKDFDPERQVNITLMAFGDGVDMRPLRKIADATAGAAYSIRNDQQLMTLFRCAVALRVDEDLPCPH